MRWVAEHICSLQLNRELGRGMFLAASERNTFSQECENPFGQCQGLLSQDLAVKGAAELRPRTPLCDTHLLPLLSLCP